MKKKRVVVAAMLSGILFLSLGTKAKVIRNLVLEGGGIRGIAYVGAIEVLEERHIAGSICNVAGTSVGAVAGCLFSLGYTSSEMRRTMEQLHIQTFNDGRWIFLGGLARTANRFGWYRGDALERWIGTQIASRTGNEHLTFAQLHRLTQNDNGYRDLYVTATNLSRQHAVVFSWKTFPDMEIRTAVRASMSVPLYFSAMFLDDRGRKSRDKKPGPEYDVYVDGGILANYPLSVFDSGYEKTETLGLKLERPEQIGYQGTEGRVAPFKIRDFKTYIASFYNIVLEGLNNPPDLRDEASRTVYISTGNIGPRVRKIGRQKKQTLYENGRMATITFLDKQGS